MKKLLMIICMMAVAFTLSSCKYVSRNGDRSEVQSEEASPASQGQDDATKDTASYGNTENEGKDKTIKLLKDSIDSLSVRMYAAQNDIAKLKSDVKEIRAEKLSTKSFFLFLAIFFVITIVLVYFLVKKFGLSIKQVEQIASQVWKKEAAGHNDCGQGTSNSYEHSLLKKIASLEKTINDIQSRVSRIDRTTSTDTANNRKTIPDANNSESTPKDNSHIFYLCKPSSEREFLDKARRYVAQEDYLYKFELHKGNAKKASFEFCATKENCVRWALDSQSTMIDRACDANIENRDNGRCECTANGEVELRGDKWVVTKKAKVRFY